MLYIPWRDEEKDIIRGCDSYCERYEQVSETVSAVKMQFECNAAAVDQAIEQVQKVGVDEEVWDEEEQVLERVVVCLPFTMPSSAISAAVPETVLIPCEYYSLRLQGRLPITSEESLYTRRSVSLPTRVSATTR
ncbi:hypothetical protein BaRGS_00027682 [Batillaria attramentaria]|uniref:Uncharacterized protein n=1 Tax=Batillaria attramentaria TaxID=370345 RepID=A0ABD0K207_9CAEN